MNQAKHRLGSKRVTLRTLACQFGRKTSPRFVSIAFVVRLRSSRVGLFIVFIYFHRLATPTFTVRPLRIFPPLNVYSFSKSSLIYFSCEISFAKVFATMKGKQAVASR